MRPPGPGRVVELRPITPEDRRFLLDLYATTRAAELALVPWDEATRRAFVTQQFDAQDASWRRQNPDGTFDVVVVDGIRAGRLCVDRRADEVRVVDITLAPEHRGQGVGTRLLTAVIAESEATGKATTIHVERSNPALRLYTRLGFEVVDDLGIYLFLRRPAGQPKTAS
ncbi:GNAT family N-acetyltransferase [Intrasporangium oryzae]|uniref:GNAT family N-acetyltransferase n=1 Tax=Intrasporangium oryzae TaxID=412687 RepID=UPI0005512528|nr:GNAT family N-acetyltransferase [Intrasporangium oryzae]